MSKQLFALIFICLVLTFLWFSKGLMFAGGEEGLSFFNPSRTFDLVSPTWVETGTGYSSIGNLTQIPYYLIFKILYSLGIPTILLQSFHFFLIMTVGVLSCYLLLKITVEKELKERSIISNFNYFSFIGAVFYLLNPFSMTQIFGRGIFVFYFAFALHPLFLALFILGIQKRSLFYSFFALIASIVFSATYGFYGFALSQWFLVSVYLIFYLITHYTDKNKIIFATFFFLASFLAWFFVHMFWILPVLKAGPQQLAGTLNNIEENIGSLRGVSTHFPLPVLIRLLHTGYFYENLYGSIYHSLFFNLISWIIPIVSFFSITKFKKITYFKIYGIILIISLFISLGSNFPTGWIFELIFKNISYFQMYRNPYEKFGLILLIAYTPFFSLGTLVVSEKIAKILKAKLWKMLSIFLIIFLVCGIYLWPMWVGKFAGGFLINTWVKVPDYYNDLRIWLDKSKEQFRVVMTPIWPGEGAFYQWNGNTYQGIDPMEFLINTQAISRSVQIPFYFDFITSIRKYLDRINVTPAFSLLRAYYLVDRKDAIFITEAEKNHYKFLTSTLYPPKGAESDLRVICQNKIKVLDVNWVACQIPAEEMDLSKSKYLHLKIKTNIPANLEVVVRDTNQVSISWDGRKDPDYSTDNSDWRFITIPLSSPTGNNSKIDFSKINYLDIHAYPLNVNEKNIREISVAEIKIDPGEDKQINEFKEVKEFGNLKVYEPINFNPPPEFGVLSSVKQVKDFSDLFNQVNSDRKIINIRGFLIPSQNPNKDLNQLSITSPIYILSEEKISNTRYWLNIDKHNSQGLIILSKTFDPGWKIIPIQDKQILNNNLFNDINLLRGKALDESNHYVINGYANLWKIGSENSQYAIVFIPQVIGDIGLKVSIFSIILLTSSMILWQIKKYKSSH